MSDNSAEDKYSDFAAIEELDDFDGMGNRNRYKFFWLI